MLHLDTLMMVLSKELLLGTLLEVISENLHVVGTLHELLSEVQYLNILLDGRPELSHLGTLPEVLSEVPHLDKLLEVL